MDSVGLDLLGPKRDGVRVEDVVVTVGGVIGEVDGDWDDMEVWVGVELLEKTVDVARSASA